MRKTIFVVTAIGTCLVVALIACSGGNTKPATTVISNDSLIKRGDYLVTVLGCDDCHSPKVFGPKGPENDPERRLSGHPATTALGPIDTSVMSKGWVLFSMSQTATVGPWGVSYAANLSSDSTGIGMWTEEQFFRAIRKGLYKGLEGSRPLMPPMPWQGYSKLTDEDLRAIFAYLKSTKPVKNPVPAWRPFNTL